MANVNDNAGSLAGYTCSQTGDRLSATGGGITGSYSYETGTHHLASAGGVSRSYDANGNTTSGIRGFAFSYGCHNRLAGAYQPRNFDSWSYGYNGKGERVRKLHVAQGIAGPIELSDTRYVYSQGGQSLGEYDDKGLPIAEYIYLGTLPVAMATKGGLHYILSDHLGTPRQVIDPATRTPVWEWSLLGSAFGVHAPNEDPDGDGEPFTLNLRFPGQGRGAIVAADIFAGTGRNRKSAECCENVRTNR